MDEVFGLPLAGLMVVLLGMLALCLLAVAWVAWRRPVIFNLGARNIPRRKAQTTSLAEPDAIVTGLDPAYLDAFGGLKSTGGQAIDLAAIGRDAVVVSEL